MNPRFCRVLLRHRIASLATLLCTALSVRAVRSQEPVRSLSQLHHTAWTASDGAPADIRALAQTTDGYLWLGTRLGLFRFDGVRFTRFEARAGDSISAGRILSLLAAHDGSLWIGWGSGAVSRLRDGRVTTFGEGQRLPFTQRMAEASDGTIVAATSKGLVRFRHELWEDVSRAWNFPGTKARLVYYDRSGALWVLTEDRVVYLPAGQRQFVDPGERAAGGDAFAEAPDGTMWLAEIGRSAHAVRRLGEPPESTEVRVGATSVVFDRTGAMWISTGGDGLRRVSAPQRIRGRRIAQFGPEAEQFTTQDGLSGNVAYAGMEDSEGNIWFASYRGLDRFRETVFTPVSVPHADAPRFVLATRDGALVSGSSTAPGVLRITAQGRTEWMTEAPRLATIVEGEAGVLWGIGVGVVRFQAGTVRPMHFPGNYVPTAAITTDHAGGLWFLADSGLFRFAHATVEKILGPLQPVYKFSRYLYTDRRGRVWLGQYDRVSLYDGGTVRVFAPADGIPRGVVFAICDDEAGNVWVGGDGGLSRFDNNRFRPLSSTALPTRAVSGMVQDKGADWWITTDVGVLRVTAAELNHAVADSGYRPRYRTFDRFDGLPEKPSGQYPVPIVARTADGRIWVATRNGLAYADPRRIPANLRPPPVLVENVTIDNKQVMPDDGLALAPGAHDLEIDYTALSLTIPERNQFRYMLEGRDTAWHEAGNRRQAVYTDLPPKAYRFRVIGSNNDGVWNETGATWSFRVRPAWYQTLWFRAALVLLVGVLGAIVAMTVQRFRHRREQHALTVRYESTLAERSRIAQELHDTLLQGFTGITIQLRAIQRVLTRRPEEGVAALEPVLAAADTALRDARNTIWDMRAVELEGRDLPEALEGAVRSVVAGASVALEFTVRGERRPLTLLVETTALRIGREAVLNALKHADARNVDVHLEYGTKLLRLQVRDDGRGMTPGAPEAAATNGHLGIAGMRARAHRAAGTLEIASEPGLGTTVQASLPIGS
jgi:signal transduction histidine kinase/ligand-binding sensor domain-containing protein